MINEKIIFAHFALFTAYVLVLSFLTYDIWKVIGEEEVPFNHIHLFLIIESTFFFVLQLMLCWILWRSSRIQQEPNLIEEEEEERTETENFCAKLSLNQETAQRFDYLDTEFDLEIEENSRPNR